MRSLETRIARADERARATARARYYERLDKDNQWAHECLARLGLFEALPASMTTWSERARGTGGDGGESCPECEEMMERLRRMTRPELAAFVAREVQDYFEEHAPLFGLEGAQAELSLILAGGWRR